MTDAVDITWPNTDSVVMWWDMWCVLTCDAMWHVIWCDTWPDMTCDQMWSILLINFCETQHKVLYQPSIFFPIKTVASPVLLIKFGALVLLCTTLYYTASKHISEVGMGSWCGHCFNESAAQYCRCSFIMHWNVRELRQRLSFLRKKYVNLSISYIVTAFFCETYTACIIDNECFLDYSVLNLGTSAC